MFRQALLAMRPWRLAPPPRPEAERSLLQLVAALYTALAVIVALIIVIAFLVAKLAT
jgi:flagellar biogenesis protein FliO